MLYRALLSILLVFLPATLFATDIDGEVRLGGRPGLEKPATVQLLHDHSVVSEQFTDLSGRFEFQSVEPTRYIVRAVYADMPEAEVTIDVIGSTAHYRVPVITIRPPKEKVEKAGVVSINQLTISHEATREYEKGVKDQQLGLCDQAIPHFEKAVELASNYADAYNDLGNCLSTKGKKAEAEAAYGKAVELHGSIYASINLADMYAKEKRYGEAQQLLNSAITRSPAEGDLYFALAQVEFDQGRFKEAETAGLQAHSKIHRTADVHLLLAKIYLALKNQPALIGQLEAYLKEKPTGPVAAQIRQTLKSLSPQ